MVQYVDTLDLRVIDDDENRIAGIVSVQTIDRHEELVVQESLHTAGVEMCERRLSPISVMHRDEIVGVWESVKMIDFITDNGTAPAVYIEGRFDSSPKIANRVLEIKQDIKRGDLKGLSMSGITTDSLIEGVTVVLVKWLYAVSIVDKPANPFALVMEISDKIKSLEGVKKIGNKVVITCDKLIKKFENDAKKFENDAKNLLYPHNVIYGNEGIDGMSEVQLPKELTEAMTTMSTSTKSIEDNINKLNEGFSQLSTLMANRLKAEEEEAAEKKKKMEEEAEAKKKMEAEKKKKMEEEAAKKKKEEEEAEKKRKMEEEEKNKKKNLIAGLRLDGLNNGDNVNDVGVNIRFEGYEQNPAPLLLQAYTAEYGEAKGRQKFIDELESGDPNSVLAGWEDLTPQELIKGDPRLKFSNLFAGGVA